MFTWKVEYTCYDDTQDWKRINNYRYYQADTAQDAVDQCREDFFPVNEVKIIEVYRKAYYGWESTDNWK